MMLMIIFGLVLSTIVSATNPTTTATFNNGIQYFFDTDGSAIDSTSGKIDFFNGEYVWYGLTFGCEEVFCGITSYSSPDLTTWTYNGYLFNPNTTEITTLCALNGNCGRPHIVYSELTRTYVLWVNAGTPGYVLFTSSSPTSGYVLSPDRALFGYQPPGNSGADFSVEVINGTGYLAHSLIDFTTVGASIWPPFLQSIYLQQLTPSMTNTTGTPSHVISPAGDLVDYECESPDIFKRGDYWYVTASNTCGFCTGTLLIAFRSKSLNGPWIRQIISPDTCGGQSDAVLILPSPSSSQTTYLHIADLVRTAPLTGTRMAAHGHQFQALNFNPDGSIQDLDCSDSKTISVPIVAGNAVNKTGLATTVTDSSGLSNVAYTPKCLLPSYQLYQTWTSSKSGVLSEVGFNYAVDTPTGNLTVTVFRHQNDTDLMTPRYVWDTLATIQVTPSQTTESFHVIKVPVGVAVSTGDKLGIALVSGSVTSSCVLVKGGQSPLSNGVAGIDSSSGPINNRTLFAIGANQVSYRGRDGKTPPVVVLPGEIKWYSIVE